MSKFSEAEELWKEQSAKSIQRDYSFDTVSGQKIESLYYPEDNDEFIDNINL